MATRSITLPVLLSLCAPLLPAACGDDTGRGDATDGGSTGTSPSTTTGETTDTPTGGEDQGFGPEAEFTLRLNDKPADPLTLNMNKAEVAELFGPTAKDIQLIEVESKTLLTNTLEEIKNACGTAWNADDPEPKHNCDLTELGKTFKGPDNTWKTSPEYSLVRILTMTPANSRVDGPRSPACRASPTPSASAAASNAFYTKNRWPDFRRISGLFWCYEQHQPFISSRQRRTPPRGDRALVAVIPCAYGNDFRIYQGPCHIV